MCSFKCKMCGGSLTILEDKNIAVCDFCGSKQSIPKLQSEIKMNQYERASILRRNNDYDKASALYETMLYDSPFDADLYWSLVLCKYGIEYVVDNKTSKRVPTINRSQYTSIYEDENYKLAIKYANESQKEVFINEAKVINDIQSDILLISQSEEPFDIFICYKETDLDGRRSEDSIIASELYHQLVNEGYKVFFSKVTLEDKLGSAYEPYIFAALNSAKVMLVIGTRKEHFEAVWVKNEWSRFLNLMNEDHDKVLIPLYKNMDAYELPLEFSHLQAQDMNKIGFNQDLIYGISKIVTKRNESLFTSRNSLYGDTIGITTRAELLIEDGEYDKAREVLNTALNINPKDPMIYVLLLLIEFKIKYVSELVNVKKDFSKSKNYEKALRFADDDLANKLQAYVNERIYLIASKLKADESKAENLEKASTLFDSIKYYKNSSILASNCRKKINEIVINEKYDKASNIILSFKQGQYSYQEGLRKLDEASTILKEIVTYANASLLIEECESLSEKSETAHEKKKRLRLIGAFSASVVALGLVVGYKYVNDVYLPKKAYEEAIDDLYSGNYIEALTIFNKLGDYRDASFMINETYYLMANDYFNQERYTEAINIYGNLVNYKDSYSKMNEATYRLGLKTYEEAYETDTKYQEALETFTELGNFKSSEKLVDKITYEYALYLYDERRYEEAIDKFESLEPSLEIDEYIKNSEVKLVEELYKDGEYFEALDNFEYYGLDEDSKLYADIVYKIGEYYLERGDYDKAIQYLSEEESKRNSDLMYEVKYNYVLENDDKDNMKTYDYLRELRRANYKDSAKIYNELYAWYLDVFAINTNVNSAYDYQTNLYGQDRLVFHFKVTGGTPDGSLSLRAKYKMSDGEDGSFYFDRDFKNGDIDWLSFTGVDSSVEGEPLTVEVSFRNRETGKEIAESMAVINSPIIGNNQANVTTKIVNGFYVGEARGYNDYIKVNVKVTGGEISDVRVISHNEDTGFSDAIDEMERRIVKAASTNVDTVSGATITSRAIIQAVNNALDTLG